MNDQLNFDESEGLGALVPACRKFNDGALDKPLLFLGEDKAWEQPLCPRTWNDTWTKN